VRQFCVASQEPSATSYPCCTQLVLRVSGLEPCGRRVGPARFGPVSVKSPRAVVRGLKKAGSATVAGNDTERMG
jgi:hypothetical protein